MIDLLNNIRTNKQEHFVRSLQGMKLCGSTWHSRHLSQSVRQRVSTDTVRDWDAATVPRLAADCMVPVLVAHAQTRPAQLRNASRKFVRTVYSTYTRDGGVNKNSFRTYLHFQLFIASNQYVNVPFLRN